MWLMYLCLKVIALNDSDQLKIGIQFICLNCKECRESCHKSEIVFLGISGFVLKLLIISNFPLREFFNTSNLNGKQATVHKRSLKIKQQTGK